MNDSPKILIIQTAFLGDTILALPMVQTLKNVNPESRIDFLCIPSTQNVLQNNPLIQNVIVYDKHNSGIKGFHNIIHAIRDNGYDIVLCPHRSLRSALITLFSGAKTRIGFDKNSASFLLTHKVKYENTAHEVERNLSLLKAMPGLLIRENQIELKPKLFPTREDGLLLNNLINLTDSTKLITFAPCSKWFTKQLIKDKTVRIAKELITSGIFVALIGGNEDKTYCEEVEREVNDKKLFNLCGILTPLQSYLIISKAKAHITVDSAAAHLAAATNTSIVQIYGSTVPRFGFYPLTSKHIIIEHKNLECRPCTDHGRIACPLKHFRCIVDLSVEEIVNGAIGLSS